MSKYFNTSQKLNVFKYRSSIRLDKKWTNIGPSEFGEIDKNYGNNIS